MMDNSVLDNSTVEEESISAFPEELNQLKTAELLHTVQNYPELANYEYLAQYDSLVAEVGDNIIVDDYVGNSVLIQYQQTPELPNSTMPAAPLPTGTHPCLEDFEGEFGFTICHEALNANETHSWSYSESLKQVFIKMNNVLLVKFKTTKPLGSDGNQFFIRALLVYQNNDFVSQAVNRCSIHWIDDDGLQQAHRTHKFCECIKYNLAGHVLRCQTEGAQYQYDPHSERHSVVVDVPSTPQAGSDSIKAVHYVFCCKTSCPKGMQRRAVQVVFTLEDDRCQVHGRKVLPVKICSCPKRDKDRQEHEFADRRGPKRPMNSVDEDVKPTKIEREALLYNLQIRHATRESLETMLKELVTQQQKELDQMKTLMTNLESRQNSMMEIIKQFTTNRQAHH